jgi:hypothetical protein
VPSEVALFWLLLAGFLVADNLVLVPAGGDYLKFSRDGRLHYLPGLRLQARGRDLVLLNPLSPFDRIALTRRIAGRATAGAWRASHRKVQASLPGANGLSWLGVAYLLVLLGLLVLSFQLHFGVVLAALGLWHLLAWVCGLTLLLTHRSALGLAGGQVFTLAVEALFVPAYTLNLGKRVWFRHRLDLPALTVGLRWLKRMPETPAKALYAHQLAERLDDWALDLDLDNNNSTAQPAWQRPWLKEARACLTASTPLAGS